MYYISIFLIKRAKLDTYNINYKNISDTLLFSKN